MRLAPLPAAMFTRLLLLLCSCASVLAQSAAPTGVVDYVDTDEPTPEGFPCDFAIYTSTAPMASLTALGEVSVQFSGEYPWNRNNNWKTDWLIFKYENETAGQNEAIVKTFYMPTQDVRSISTMASDNLQPWGFWKVTLTCECELVLRRGEYGDRGVTKDDKGRWFYQYWMQGRQDPTPWPHNNYWKSQTFAMRDALNECTVAPTPAPQCFIKLYTSSSSRNLQVYAEAFLNSNSAWSNRTALDFVGLYKGAMEVSSIPVFEVPAAIRLSVDDGSKEWGYWKIELDCYGCFSVLIEAPDERGYFLPTGATQEVVQYPWSYFWLGNTFPNGTYVQSQTFPVITDAGACILPTRTPTPAPLTVYSTEAPTPEPLCSQAPTAADPYTPPPPASPPGCPGKMQCTWSWFTSRYRGASALQGNIDLQFTVDGELTPYTHLVDASGWQSQNAYRKRTVSVTTCLDSYPTKFQMSSTQLQSYGWWKVTVQCSDFPCPWIIMEDPAGIDGSSFFDRPEFWIGKRNYGRRGRMKELLNVDASRTKTECSLAPTPLPFTCSPTMAGTVAPTTFDCEALRPFCDPLPGDEKYNCFQFFTPFGPCFVKPTPSPTRSSPTRFST